MREDGIGDANDKESSEDKWEFIFIGNKSMGIMNKNKELVQVSEVNFDLEKIWMLINNLKKVQAKKAKKKEKMRKKMERQR